MRRRSRVSALEPVIQLSQGERRVDLADGAVTLFVRDAGEPRGRDDDRWRGNGGVLNQRLSTDPTARTSFPGSAPAAS
jgi:hypothetical protein